MAIHIRLFMGDVANLRTGRANWPVHPEKLIHRHFIWQKPQRAYGVDVHVHLRRFVSFLDLGPIHLCSLGADVPQRQKLVRPSPFCVDVPHVLCV